ncbi:MAG: 4Fe-4S binding protein [bacterium]
MKALYNFPAYYLIEPLSSPFFLLFLLFFIAILYKRELFRLRRGTFLVIAMAFLWIAYNLSIQNPGLAKWLMRLNSPLFPVVILLVIPAIFLPRNRWYKLFLLFPILCIAAAVIDIIVQYKQSPASTGFKWFLIRPGYLITGVLGFLVFIQYFLSMDAFRKLTRITVFIILIYGGFAFRQNYTDYKEMLARRKDAVPDIMQITETVPVLRHHERLSYLPGAPCRFSADGGYVQGCPMELFQRIMQIDLFKVRDGDPSMVALISIALAALLSLLIMCYIGARWWCGWICPLSTLGDLFDTVRRWLKLPHMKPSKPVKLSYLYSGLFLGGFGLILAKAYAHIDEQGKFWGCKIPLYPFCKICPGQQLCPIASKGIKGISPLPGMEWLFGFFRVGIILLLVLFLAGFATSRRLWCRFCPMGMVGGIFNRGGLLALKKDAQKCNRCGVCNEVCPMDIHFVQEEMVKEDVSSFDCIYCLKCIDNCPQDGCLRLEFAGQRIMESDYARKVANG